MKKFVVFFLLPLLIFTACKKENINIVPSISVNDIVISKSHAYVNVGEKTILLAQVFPFNADNQKILWKSDNKDIATVDNGIVVGVSSGRTVITCTSVDGEFYDQCIVFVSTPKM